jgi:hypothetical protein
MPCPECGESVEQTASVVHRCDIDRWADYQMFGLGEHMAKFDAGLSLYLHTANGRFEVWLAAREVRKSA